MNKESEQLFTCLTCKGTGCYNRKDTWPKPKPTVGHHLRNTSHRTKSFRDTSLPVKSNNYLSQFQQQLVLLFCCRGNQEGFEDWKVSFVPGVGVTYWQLYYVTISGSNCCETALLHKVRDGDTTRDEFVFWVVKGLDPDPMMDSLAQGRKFASKYPGPVFNKVYVFWPRGSRRSGQFESLSCRQEHGWLCSLDADKRPCFVSTTTVHRSRSSQFQGLNRIQKNFFPFIDPCRKSKLSIVPQILFREMSWTGRTHDGWVRCRKHFWKIWTGILGS